jgi:putative pyrroloquinoline-quinone binding quinoprotein
LDSYLYAINSDGTLKWRFKTDEEIHSHPSIGHDGTIYFGSNDNNIYALNPDGSLKWKYKINGSIYSSVSIGDNGAIYASAIDFYAFDADGSLKWIHKYENDLVGGSSSPAISNDGIIYVGITKKGVDGGYIIALNPDGTTKWLREIGNYWIESSPSIGTDGVIYIGSVINDYPNGMYGYLYALGEGNLPPNKPTIDGPTSGKIDISYTYTILSSDSEDDQIYYFIDWGDGSNSGWEGPFNSGQETSESHIWTLQGAFDIRVKAKDVHGAESDWSTLKVTMPKGKNLPYAIERFLENHPIIYQLLSKITTNMQ